MMRPDIHAAMGRHQRVAFQFSGGRDSTAAMYLLRPYWDRMTVYHADTGDQFPELAAVVDAVAADTGLRIIRIRGDAPAYRRNVGSPFDIVPFDNTAIGRDLSGRRVKIVSRMECCAANLMAPLHERVLADGMTLLVRGTRRDEFAHLPIRSGYREDALELLYPIEHWSAQEVDEYIADHGLPVAPFYAGGMTQAPECMGCTAWWGEGRMRYLRAHHPGQAAVTESRMRALGAEVQAQLETLNEEFTHG